MWANQRASDDAFRHGGVQPRHQHSQPRREQPTCSDISPSSATYTLIDVYKRAHPSLFVGASAVNIRFKSTESPIFSQPSRPPQHIAINPTQPAISRDSQTANKLPRKEHLAVATMTEKASTCCGKSAECVCGMFDPTPTLPSSCRDSSPRLHLPSSHRCTCRPLPTSPSSRISPRVILRATSLSHQNLPLSFTLALLPRPEPLLQHRPNNIADRPPSNSQASDLLMRQAIRPPLHLRQVNDGEQGRRRPLLLPGPSRRPVHLRPRQHGEPKAGRPVRLRCPSCWYVSPFQVICWAAADRHSLHPDACTCEKAADGGFNPSENEIDFTTKK